MERVIDMKVITGYIRTTLKEEFPQYKFSVKMKGHNHITVNIVKSKQNMFVSDSYLPDWYDGKVYKHNNKVQSFAGGFRDYIEGDGDYVENRRTLYHKWFEADAKRICEIVNHYNWDNSDISTDYFDVNYYTMIGIDLSK